MSFRFATFARRRNRYASMLLTFALLALAALVVTAISVGLIWWQQERIVFQPPRFAPAAPPDIRRVDYRASDGQPLLAYLVEPSRASVASDPPPLLIGFHGNADLAVWQIPWAREVARRTGWRVLLAEYRGYGGLAGTPTYETARTDARAAVTFAVRELDAHPTRVALFGHSLGSAVATELAAELSTEWGTERLAEPRVAPTGTPSPEERFTDRGTIPAILLLQSPFTSARDMAKVATTRAVYWAWRLISRVHYDTERDVAALAAPVWVAHGERDWLVPVSMGKQVFATARTQGRLLLVPGAGHNDVAVVGGEAYWSWLTDALTAAAGTTQAPRPR